MKESPAVIAARSGEQALELVEFQGSKQIPNRDAVGFYYRIRLKPGDDISKLAVLFSGTVFYWKPYVFGLPDQGNRERNFRVLAEAAIGDYLDDTGLPAFTASGASAAKIECFSPHFQSWVDRSPASDDVIKAYISSHLLWAWKYGHETWETTPSDTLRLRQNQNDIARLIKLGEGKKWKALSRTSNGAVLAPTPQLLRRERGAMDATRERTQEPEVTKMPAPEAGAPSQEGPSYVYVDEVRIADLRRVQASQYDLQKLIALCEELNVCYRSQCYHAVAALTRAVLDHIPPILGSKSFPEVANNYGGSKSFKACMQRLEGARKIADGHLHTQVRKSEVLPTRTQVNFSNELDVLLGEIVRVLDE